MRFSSSVSAKLAATGAALLLLALAAVGLTLWVTWNLDGGAAAVNEAGRMRMQTYRLALSVAADPRAAGEPQALARDFDRSLALLAEGDASRPLSVPWTQATRERFDAVRGRWQTLRAAWLAGTPSATLRGDADAFVGLVDGFVAGIERQIARWTAMLRVFQVALMGLAVASAAILFHAGWRLVVQPLARLQCGLAAVQDGRLGTRVAVRGRDEFGELAAGFNAMAATLESLYAGLEQKVREKTRRLEAEHERLAALYAVSGLLAEAPTIEALGQGFAREVRRIGRADAAAVRWCDEDTRRYLLLAHDGLPEAIVRDEACLETGACHCGQPAATARTRAIPIVPAAAGTLGHCGRAGFQTVLAVPVRLQERLLGEVELFYRAPTRLADDDRDLLDALARQLASALASHRASALAREAAVAQERGLIARELHDSIAQSLLFMKIQVQLLRQAVQRGDGAAIAHGLAELEAGVRESYADVRELLLHFRTRTNEEDIATALRTTLQKFEHQTGLPAHLAMEGHGLPLAADVQVQVLHILQEALSNVRKHARASAVTLRVRAGARWRFEVRDDGVGFAPHDPGRASTHVGLGIMQERAHRIGAELHIASLPGEGCVVILELPAAVHQDALPTPAATLA